MRREPALLLNVAAALLGLIVTFGVDWLSAEQAALIVAALNAGFGVLTAVLTRPIAPAAFTAFISALAALGAAYGLEYSQENVGALNVLVLAVLAFLTRVQVSPAPPNAPVT